MSLKAGEMAQGVTVTMVRGGKEPSPSQNPALLSHKTFLSGDVVAERYRVIRFIGEGSCGEVYEVEDLSLRERVALKTIRPERAFEPGTLKRFKQELRLARRVTHAHVCRVFDLGEHSLPRSAEARSHKVLFLTMELLEGQTLREYVLRKVPLSTEQVLALGRQMASALDAAHAAQVIHRDFKSSNVVLVEETTAGQGLRAVVTDFGLALGVVREETAEESQESRFAGTPSYMSPEQVEGNALSRASDLYSLGVVLYEMVTGRLPFVADTAMATALQRLHAPPAPPSTWARGLAPRWDEVLLRCLARRPEDRFPTAMEALGALQEQEVTSFVERPRLGQFPASSLVTRRVMAVLGLRSLWARPDMDWLATALAEVLAAELAACRQVRLLSGEEVAVFRQELHLPEVEGLSRETLRRIRVHSQVDLLLSGTYLVLGPPGGSTLRLDIHVQDTATGEPVVHLTETGLEQELLALLARVGARLRAQLGLGPLTSEQAGGVRLMMPVGPGLARLYAEGLTALRSYDAALAVERLEQVVAREPTFVMAHSALAEAFQRLYQVGRAREAARRAFELSEGLPLEERLLVRARHHAAQADWDAAVEDYQALLELCPDSVEYGIALMSAQMNAGRFQAAGSTLERLWRLPLPLSEDPRIYVAAAAAMATASDFESSLRHAATAVEKARLRGQWLIVAEALTSESFAIRTLGAPGRSLEKVEEAERLCLSCGDRGGALSAMLGRAVALLDLVRLHEAKQVLASASQLVGAYRGAVIEAEVLALTGWLKCALGDLPEALRSTGEAQALFQRLELRAEANHYRIQRAMILRHQGALSEAQAQLREGGRVAKALGDDYSEAWSHHELGNLLLDQGELSAARACLGLALKLRRARGFQAFVVDTALDLARVALREGHWEEALSLAEQACSFYEEQEIASKQGMALALMARVKLVRGETQDARELLARARKLEGSNESIFIQTELLCSWARLVAQAGTFSERREGALQLQDILKRTRAGGLVQLELQARLAQAELELLCGGGLATDAYTAIAEEAERLGYFAIARRAQAAVQR
ncbi:protein kinase domain-containing protein [Stigmatella aurantiaca]|nr:protein kinase [Stigmatella aurantiaca]